MENATEEILSFLIAGRTSNNNSDHENDDKDAQNTCAQQEIKNDLIQKADEFFNSGCKKKEKAKGGSKNHFSMPPDDKDLHRLLPEQNNSECDTDLLKYCVATGVDDTQIPLEKIDSIKQELNALENSYDAKLPSYSKEVFEEIASAENIERILNLPPFDPNEPQFRFTIKRALSLSRISHSKNNLIEMVTPMGVEYVKSEEFNPMTETLNTFAKHESDEFCTFCSCKECIAYREIAIHIMMEQFKASHMIVLLLDAIMKAYSPLLRNATAFNGLEKLLENNKDIYWIASGLIYNKKYEHLDLIYDETLTDPMILVLFSSILMINNPMQLLQILAFYLKCIVKAFAVGICEIPADEKLAYIIDGFDHLCEISEQIAMYLFVFEKYFLNRFSLSWVCLCQRLFHQHVYMKFFVAITNSGEGLKSDDPLKARYFDFAKRIICTDMRWNRAIWPKLQRYNLSDEERNRRRSMLHIHHLFDAIVEDALRLPLEESSDDNLFYDIHSLENRRLAWQNIMAFAKMRWPDGFFNSPNTLVLDFRCEKCGAINEQHESKCKCVTCAIGGDPFLPPSKMKNICLDCLLKQRKISDESSNQPATESTTLHQNEVEDLKDLLCGFLDSKRSKERSKQQSSNISKMGFLERFFEGDISDLSPEDPYHISWATFKHISQRERYIHTTVDEKYFCKDCLIPACMLAKKLLNNEMAPELTSHLVTYFHPLPLHKHELRALLPSVIYYNQRFCTVKNESSFHNVVVKAYWNFVVSLYTTYFYDFVTPSPLNLSAFEIEQSDIKLIPEKLTGNLEDMQFFEFLAAIWIFAPPDGFGDPAVISAYLQREDVAEQVENFLKSQIEDRRKKLISMSMMKVPQSMDDDTFTTLEIEETMEPSVSNASAVTVQPTSSNNANLEMMGAHGIDIQQKKGAAANVNSKPKKCCFEHVVDLGSSEHCKDNHAGKKRLKKDCGHARVNETRDRLRKKLLSSRKYQQQQQYQHHHQQQQLQQKQMQHQQQQQQQLPNTQTTKSFASTNGQIETTGQLNHQQQPTVRNLIDTQSDGSIYDDRECNNMDTERSDSDGSDTLLPATPPPIDELSLKTYDINDSEENVIKPDEKNDNKNEKAIGKVIEICDMIDDNKLNMKKWIDETLTYIEGYASTSKPMQNGTSSFMRKSQPQTKNPKKAAKKAKQKLRKEEEKRISELHEVRAQFQDIYFKEFLEKIELRSLKSIGGGGSGSGGGGSFNGGASSKRRCDKKKIAEIEANIKKLQRAKAKLEGNILELIATVKQTNNEFKFPYLPTKEQQQAKLYEIEQAKLPQKPGKQQSPAEPTPSTPEHVESQKAYNTTTTSGPGASEGDDVFNYVPLPAKFFPNISFPYEMSFPGLGGNRTATTTTPHVQQKVGMCYTPTQQQLSSSNSISSASNSNDNAINEPSSIILDPSKRIVTIRRVHNPNLNDSQVTVTARGSSPNEDKLLYTFINGQLVPTNGNPTATTNSSDKSINSTKSEAQTLNKTQLKKERRKQAKLELAKQTKSSYDNAKEIVQAEKPQKLSKSKGKIGEIKPTKDNNNKNTQQSEEALPNNNNNTNTKTKAISKKVKKAEVTENKRSQQQQQQQQLKKGKLNEVKSNKSIETQTVKASAKTEHSIGKNLNSIAVQTVVSNSTTKEQRRLKLLNHGQFDNNPYKTLHLQDSESELELTASSCDEEESVSDVAEENIVAQICEKISEKKPKLKKQQQQQQQLQKVINENTKTVVKKSNLQKEILKPMQQPSGNKSTAKANVEQRGNKIKSNGIKKQTENEDLKKNSNETKTAERRGKQKENTKQHSETVRDHVDGSHNSDRKKTGIGNANNTRSTTAKLHQNPLRASDNKTNSNRSSTGSAVPKRDSNMPPTHSNDTKSMSKRTQQRTRKKQLDQQQQQQHHSHKSFTDCGIPAHMEHFNPAEVNIIKQKSQKPPPPSHLESLSHQFQGLQIEQDTKATATTNNNLMPSYASVSANKSTSNGMSTVSIMDQLNRGVQVENLSLPPGITLTKVDPIKSEQLRQKSESIKRLSQPLQPHSSSSCSSNNVPIMATGFQHHGSTIIAPPVGSYLPAQYISPSVPMDQGNIIMVESLSNSSSSKETKAKTNPPIAKAASKNKRRRNKGKRTEANAPDRIASSSSVISGNEQLPKMITLRNPMFHAGPSAAAASILPQPNQLANRHGFGNSGENSGSSFPASVPMDQPAAIIKNENGMYTIRNPALHQAVTNGMALSGYRQFGGGNVSYYTPQEAVADASRSTQQQQKKSLQKTAGPTESFSYFSNNPTNIPAINIEGPRTVTTATSPTKPSNKISISCASSDDMTVSGFSQIDNPTRPSSAQRCISAIGSEIKNNRSWSEYRQQENLSNSHENLSSVSTVTLVGNSNNMLDENHKSGNNSSSLLHRSNYYNGFEVFPSQNSNGSISADANSALVLNAHGTSPFNLNCPSNTLFDSTASDAHMHHLAHHNCGDDSPPPTSLLGYSSSYLDDIPNTGVIRYDDASFLKNLIPGQRLNKEVSIHNINESKHGRNTSPMSHLVEITPVYSGNNNNNKISQAQEGQTNVHQHFSSTNSVYSSVCQQNFNEFDPNAFPSSNTSNFLKPNNSDESSKDINISNNVVERETQPYNMFDYDFENITEMNSMFAGGGGFSVPSGHRQRASSFLDETAMEDFVQNLNSLQIGSETTTVTSFRVEQCSKQQLIDSRESELLGNASKSNATNSTGGGGGWW